MSTSTPHEPGSINLSAWVCAFLALTLMAALLQAIVMLAHAQVFNAQSRDTRQLVQEARMRACLAETRWEDRTRCEFPEATLDTANVWPPRHPLDRQATLVSAR